MLRAEEQLSTQVKTKVKDFTRSVLRIHYGRTGPKRGLAMTAQKVETFLVVGRAMLRNQGEMAIWQGTSAAVKALSAKTDAVGRT